MQRLGFCKLVVVLAPMISSSGELAKSMRERLEDRSVPVKPSEDLEKWMARKGGAPFKQYESSSTIALQDYYVWNHPSKSGWLSRGGYVEYAEYLPRQLGLVDDVFRRTDIGDVLADVLLRPTEIGGLEAGSPTDNILTLDLPQRILFLHQLLAADGDFLIPFVKSIATKFEAMSFTYLDAGALLPAVCRDAARAFGEYAYSKDDREILRRLESTGEKIKQQIAESIETQGSGSRREQTSIPRLEWLVDLGFVARRGGEASSRVFTFTPEGLRFAAQASSAYDHQLTTSYADKALSSVLEDDFYEIAARAFVGASSSESNPSDFIEFIRPAYQRLSKLRGYYLLRPLLLLRNGQMMQSVAPEFIEYSRAVELMENTYKASPDRISYSIDRFSTDYQVRLIEP